MSTTPDTDDPNEQVLAIWHEDHRVDGPQFTYAEVWEMLESDDPSRVPGYTRGDHGRLWGWMEQFVSHSIWGWIGRDLLDNAGFTREFAYRVPLVWIALDEGAYSARTLASSLLGSPWPLGSIDRFVRAVAGEARGYWFFAGWIDQAVLHLGHCREGGAEDLPVMLRQLDEDQVEESGDMAIGFLREDRDWLLAIEVSSDDERVGMFLRTESRSEATRRAELVREDGDFGST